MRPAAPLDGRLSHGGGPARAAAYGRPEGNVNNGRLRPQRRTERGAARPASPALRVIRLRRRPASEGSARAAGGGGDRLSGRARRRGGGCRPPASPGAGAGGTRHGSSGASSREAEPGWAGPGGSARGLTSAVPRAGGREGGSGSGRSASPAPGAAGHDTAPLRAAMRVSGLPSRGDPGLPQAAPDSPGLQVPACSASGAVTSDAALSLGDLYPDVGPFPSPEGKNGGAAAGRAGTGRPSSATICRRVAALGTRAWPGALGETAMRPGGQYGGGAGGVAVSGEARPRRVGEAGLGRDRPGRAGASPGGGLGWGRSWR